MIKNQSYGLQKFNANNHYANVIVKNVEINLLKTKVFIDMY